MRTVSAEINQIALAKTFAVIGLIGYLLCVIATVLFPEFLLNLFNSWVHGVDISSLTPANGDWVSGTGNLVLGLITFPIFGWITGYFIAFTYNKFNK